MRIMTSPPKARWSRPWSGPLGRPPMTRHHVRPGTQLRAAPPADYEENIMHPMFVKLFLETGADDLLADEEQKRPADLAKRNRSRMAMRITARGRDRQPRP